MQRARTDHHRLEVVALWRRVREHADWEQLMRQRFVDELWARTANLFSSSAIRFGDQEGFWSWVYSGLRNNPSNRAAGVDQ